MLSTIGATDVGSLSDILYVDIMTQIFIGCLRIALSIPGQVGRGSHTGTVGKYSVSSTRFPRRHAKMVWPQFCCTSQMRPRDWHAALGIPRSAIAVGAFAGKV